MSKATPITLVGAGLVGSLLALRLSQAGFAVDLFERRPDPRRAGFLGGRSINLALSERGLRPLREAGLAEQVLDGAVMMRGRMIHGGDGSTALQRYGIDDREVNWSVSRGQLNIDLLEAAESAGARLHFGQTLSGADFSADPLLRFEDADGDPHTHACKHVIGCDGAGSALRAEMNRAHALGEQVEPLPHGYKELEIPSATDCSDGTFDGAFRMEPRALHIWPRGGHMCIALPNRDGSFTVTLFLPLDGGEASFTHIRTPQAARRLFEREFADALPLMPQFDAHISEHPVGNLATLYLDRWNLGGKALLIGDASHAIVPFHGQGMNAGFEDVDLLVPALADADDPGAVFEAFATQRKPDADAIARMALENYIEMRDSVIDPHYLLKRKLAAELTSRCPDHFMPRYRMVTFTHLPYARCLERGRQQDAMLEHLLAGLDTLDDFDFDAAAERLCQALPPIPLQRTG